MPSGHPGNYTSLTDVTSEPGPYTSLGREIRARYGWGASENVSQQDGLFVAPSAILGLELKLRAPSSPMQIVKYAALFAWEEMHTGFREHLGLLYVLEKPADTMHWRRCGLDGAHVDAGLLDRVDAAKLPKKIRELMEANEAAVRSVLERTVIGAITWSDLRDACIAFCKNLDEGNPGDQTLIRLVDGFAA